MRVLCTGNPELWTIAHAVKQVFKDSEFVHKSNGYDFLTDEGLTKFRNKVKDFDVFINASRIQNGVQSTLLKIVREEWTKGHVINIGTTMEFHFFHHIDPECAKDKLHLRNLGLDMYDEHFRTTHLIVGGHKDQSGRGESKLDSIHIANTIKWILDSSSQFHIPIIGVENDFWNKGQEGSGCDWNELKNKGRDSSLYD